MKKQIILDSKQIAFLEQKIADLEALSSAELKIIIGQSSPVWRFGKRKPVFNKAKYLFKKYGLYKTKDNTAVLLFISLKERKLQILADKGIYAKVGQHQLDQIALKIVRNFAQYRYFVGIMYLMDQLSPIMIDNFPIQADDENEISNSVIIE